MEAAHMEREGDRVIIRSFEKLFKAIVNKDGKITISKLDLPDVITLTIDDFSELEDIMPFIRDAHEGLQDEEERDGKDPEEQ